MNLNLDYQAWMTEAVCASTDPEAYFPQKGAPPYAVKRICQTCPVQAECLQYAIDNELNHGVWGGLTERERRPLKHEAAT